MTHSFTYRHIFYIIRLQQCIPIGNLIGMVINDFLIRKRPHSCTSSYISNEIVNYKIDKEEKVFLTSYEALKRQNKRTECDKL